MGCEALPSDMIFEILSRCSLETLDQCNVVSKSWKQMIYEATFLPLHTIRSHCIFGYLFQDVISNKYRSVLVSEQGGGGVSWTSDHDDMRIVASSDQGILCCEKLSNKNKNHRYYACKPTTKQWQPLPNPKLRYRTAAVAIVVCTSSPLHYIIVRLSNHGIKYNCEVFDSQIWAWEKTESPILGYCDFISPHQAAVAVGQSVYWLTNKDNVLAFNIKRRSFRCFRLPPCNCNHKLLVDKGGLVFSNSYYKLLVEYEGGLGFTCMDGGGNEMELWVAGSGDDEGKWRRKMVVEMSVVLETLCYHRPIGLCNSDVAVMTTDNGAAFYNVQNCSFSRVKVPYDLRHARQIFRFRSDLEIVNLKSCSL